MATASVRVRLVVEVKPSDTWGDDCTLGQVQKQGVTAALAILERALGENSRVRIVGVDSCDVVLNEERK